MRLRCLPILLAFAAASLRAETLNWEQVLAEAGRANPDLAAADETLRQARLDLARTGAAFLPRASASASLNRSGPYSLAGGFEGGDNGASASLNASLNLFNGFGDLAARAKARARLDSAVAARDATRARLGYELRTAFLTLQQAQERETQASDIARRRKDNVDLVQLRFEAGRENKGSLLQTQALAAQAAWQARRATRARLEAAGDLARLLGREDGEGLLAAGELSLPADPPAALDPGLFKGLPSLRQAEADLRAAQADQRSARAAWWPSLNASASAGRSGGDWLSESGSWSTGLSLSLPLFTGGTRLVDSLAASSRLTAATLAEAGAQRQARVTLRQSLDAYLDGMEQADVQARFLDASQVRAEVARAQYTQGLLSFDTWDQIETDLINAQISALSSRGDAQRAAAAFERDLGRSPWP